MARGQQRTKSLSLPCCSHREECPFQCFLFIFHLSKHKHLSGGQSMLLSLQLTLQYHSLSWHCHSCPFIRRVCVCVIQKLHSHPTPNMLVHSTHSFTCICVPPDYTGNFIPVITFLPLTPFKNGSCDVETHLTKYTMECQKA